MFSRGDRLKEVFKVELTTALRGVKDPGLLGFLTVTDLALSPDMKTATVYYSVLGTAREKESTARALARSAPYLRQVMRKRLKLKTIPHFVFSYDETPQKASRIDKLLLQLERDTEERKP
jgi:ribosome-binding factor A